MNFILYLEVIDIDKFERIGDTPLIHLINFEKINNISNTIYAKLEYCNPFGSIKDRAALEIFREAEKYSILSKETCIIEATSGNMGIALAGISKIKGYNCKIIMPENMSGQRKQLIKSYGAELILTSADLGMNGSIKKAEKLQKQSSDNFYTNQFHNIACVNAHRIFTAPEIHRQSGNNVDVIIAGIGTGATVRGINEFYKGINKSVEIIGVLPSKFPHKIQGIGAGFDPPFLDSCSINEIIYVDDAEAFSEKNNIYKTDNLHVGLSSGAVIAALKKVVIRKKYRNKFIVLIFADGGDRYE